ncbi:exopolysaccharide biosynthesis polyprenyl glycosylphosphotransferase [Radicibacter daui]|uniref:exopolysaccharide biosynthesis polyprenyl glycosylphosphotransferase n=1 Tax=Radicibacter daui TaxID=3064829 RepID=UPI004046A26A
MPDPVEFARSTAALEQMMRQRSLLSHGLINNAVKLGDILCLCAAGIVASTAPTSVTLLQSLLISLVALYPFRTVSGNRRVYRWDHYQSLARELADLLIGLVAASLVAWLFLRVFHDGTVTTPWLTHWSVTALLCTGALRLSIRLLVRVMQARKVLTHRVAIIGASDEGEAVVRLLQSDRLSGNAYEIVGIFDDRAARRQQNLNGIEVTQGIDALIEFSRRNRVDVIVVALPLLARERIASMLQKLNSIPADILLLMEMNWLNVKEVKLRDVDGYSFLQVARRPLVGSRALIKVIEDYIVATIGVILTSPIMIATAVALKFEGGGPVLFRQRRIGFNNREFDIFKFRSMRIDPYDDGARGTSEDDPRITRVGRFIRKYSIDELPQLFNVLRGEMSVVGPRAHVPNMLVGNQVYYEAVVEYTARHRVKPGITGLAQISGMRGGIHTEERARRSVELDLDYISSWSPWLDIVIMARTLFAGLWGRNVF